MQYTIDGETKIEYDVVTGQNVSVEREVVAPVVTLERPEPIIPDRYVEVDYITPLLCDANQGAYINIALNSTFDIWGYSVCFSLDVPTLEAVNRNESQTLVCGFDCGNGKSHWFAIDKINQYTWDNRYISWMFHDGTQTQHTPSSQASLAINSDYTCIFTKNLNDMKARYRVIFGVTDYDSYSSNVQTINPYTSSEGDENKEDYKDITLWLNAVNNCGVAGEYDDVSYGKIKIRYKRLKLFKFKQVTNISYPEYTDDDMIARLVPVYDTISGKYGMYDTIGRTFYGKGSGSDVDFTGPQIINS